MSKAKTITDLRAACAHRRGLYADGYRIGLDVADGIITPAENVNSSGKQWATGYRDGLALRPVRVPVKGKGAKERNVLHARKYRAKLRRALPGLFELFIFNGAKKIKASPYFKIESEPVLSSIDVATLDFLDDPPPPSKAKITFEHPGVALNDGLLFVVALADGKGEPKMLKTGELKLPKSRTFNCFKCDKFTLWLGTKNVTAEICGLITRQSKQPRSAKASPS